VRPVAAARSLSPGRSASAEATLRPLGLVAGMSGNLMEWYDFALYGVMARTLAEVFFPHAGRLLALLSVFGVFAAGYLMRLVGGALFGHLGDRVGRRRALLLSAGTMAIATSLVGLLPSYAAVGVLAPILFTVFRLLQGLSVGGEFTTSISYLVEHAPPGRRGLQGSFAGLTAGAGILLGSAVGSALFGLLSADEVRDWGWRIPFLLSVPLGVGLAALRMTLPEDAPASPASDGGADARKGTSPVRRALREHPGEIVRGIAMGWGLNASFYVVAVFLGSFLATERLLPEDTALRLQTSAVALMVVLTPLAGHLADRLGRKPMVLISAGGCLLLSWPLFAVLRNENPADDLLVQLVFALFVVAGLAPYQVWLAERFPRAVRASGLGIAYNAAAGVLGGTTPLVCTTLADWSGSSIAPAGYVGLATLATLIAALWTPDTSRAGLD
jgi:MHS family proline/betaine transporter-like MFS transporter